MKDNIKGGALTEVTYFILLALYQPNHGYGIMQFVEQQTNGRLVLGAGTLYGAINTLAAKNWIAPLSNETTARKKDYVITALGKEIIETEVKRLEQAFTLGRSMIEGIN